MSVSLLHKYELPLKSLGSSWYGYGGQTGEWVAIALDLATIRYLMVMTRVFVGVTFLLSCKENYGD
ncbi:hypothetical protein [Leptolyngbya sp. CCY15150]|uniref:hypothetical protein n=1 Tax=Leptolyngbya sp. CCY15150 TaxID=2767772 RepID=UPI00195213C8|nr:hypothetical protein [Leptolyngbya sp. CCY15150]